MSPQTGNVQTWANNLGKLVEWLNGDNPSAGDFVGEFGRCVNAVCDPNNPPYPHLASPQNFMAVSDDGGSSDDGDFDDSADTGEYADKHDESLKGNNLESADGHVEYWHEIKGNDSLLISKPFDHTAAAESFSIDLVNTEADNNITSAYCESQLSQIVQALSVYSAMDCSAGCKTIDMPEDGIISLLQTFHSEKTTAI